MTHVCDVTHLKQNFPAVHAHGIHGAEGHEGDGDGGGRVHRIIITAQHNNNLQ